jgi:hypothetical protein
MRARFIPPAYWLRAAATHMFQDRHGCCESTPEAATLTLKLLRAPNTPSRLAAAKRLPSLQLCGRKRITCAEC